MLYRIIPFLLVLSACGSSPDPSPTPCSDLAAIGTWLRSDGLDTIKLNADCSGTGSYCNSNFKFSRPADDGYSTTLRILSTDSTSGCLPTGDHRIKAYVAANGRLVLDLNNDGNYTTYDRK